MRHRFNALAIRVGIPVLIGQFIFDWIYGDLLIPLGGTKLLSPVRQAGDLLAGVVGIPALALMS